MVVNSKLKGIFGANNIVTIVRIVLSQFNEIGQLLKKNTQIKL